MALIYEYSEKDIEDYLWKNPEPCPFIDNWLDRQLKLCNGTFLDLLGYKNTKMDQMNWLLLN